MASELFAVKSWPLGFLIRRLAARERHRSELASSLDSASPGSIQTLRWHILLPLTIPLLFTKIRFHWFIGPTKILSIGSPSRLATGALFTPFVNLKPFAGNKRFWAQLKLPASHDFRPEITPKIANNVTTGKNARAFLISKRLKIITDFRSTINGGERESAAWSQPDEKWRIAWNRFCIGCPWEFFSRCWRSEVVRGLVGN